MSANPTCSRASVFCSRLRSKLTASTTVTNASSRVLALTSGATKKVDATGAGSARPVVSIRIASSLPMRSWIRPSVSIRSPRTVQHRQPLLNSINCSSSSPKISWPSMPISPNSLTMTATVRPCRWLRMVLTSVVFPDPRKPVMIVTGILPSGVALFIRSPLFTCLLRPADAAPAPNESAAGRMTHGSGRGRQLRHLRRAARRLYNRFGQPCNGFRQDDLAVRRRQHVAAQFRIRHDDPARAAPDALPGETIEPDRRFGDHRTNVDQPRVLVELFLPGELVVHLLAGPERVEIGLGDAGENHHRICGQRIEELVVEHLHRLVAVRQQIMLRHCALDLLVDELDVHVTWHVYVHLGVVGAELLFQTVELRYEVGPLREHRLPLFAVLARQHLHTRVAELRNVKHGPVARFGAQRF